jgi:hypothetical protein
VTHRIEVEPRANGLGAHFRLDGHDISDVLTSYTATHDAFQGPRVTLELPPYPFRAQLENSEVQLAPEIVDLLTQLGWTPPTHGAAA